MASRRMFLKAIIDSAKFIKMPSSSRLLYYDLGMRADDDGVVEGFNVLRMTGATEDDLRILMAKGFIQVLNEELVCHISDWREHNKLRADRKIDSVYKDLLLQVIPEVDLLERKPKNYKNTENKECQPDVRHLSAEDRLGKDRLGKDSIVQTSIDKKENLLSAGSERSDVLNILEKRGFKNISEGLLEGIIKDYKEFGTSEFTEAVRIADENGKHNYAYVKGIMVRRKERGPVKQIGKNDIKNFEETKDNFLRDVEEMIAVDFEELGGEF